MINYKICFVLALLRTFTHFSFSQNDTTKRILNFKGSISATNNGFSVIPSFALGKPATIINLAIGGKKFSFEPELRFSLEGKPWSFLFWGRYKLLKTDKFSLNIGMHPALNFRAEIVSTANGDSKEVMVTRRYLAGEFSPSYQLSKNIGVGVYYLYSRGIDEGTTKNTNFVALRGNLSNIPLSKKLFLQFNPQIFYLKTDDRDGVYFTSIMTLTKRDFPISISSIMNKAIQTNIVSKDFDWNVSLVYSFNKKFVRE